MHGWGIYRFWFQIESWKHFQTKGLFEFSSSARGRPRDQQVARDCLQLLKLDDTNSLPAPGRPLSSPQFGRNSGAGGGAAEGIDLWGREDVPEVDSVSQVDHDLAFNPPTMFHLCSLFVLRSFFGKPVSKKAEKTEGAENGAKTKKDTASGWVAVTHNFTAASNAALL